MDFIVNYMNWNFFTTHKSAVGVWYSKEGFWLEYQFIILVQRTYSFIVYFRLFQHVVFQAYWQPEPAVQIQYIVSHPVALDAKAELLESRALTSMIQYSRDEGCRAYWMLHSPTMPRWRTTLMAVSRSMWYSSLDNVWLGATTMESPEEQEERLGLWTILTVSELGLG